VKRNPRYGTIFEQWEIKTAERWAENFRGLPGYSTEDLVQECLIKWFDVKSKQETYGKKFMTRVLKNFLLNLKDQVQAEKRRAINEGLSMDKLLEDGKSTLHDHITNTDPNLENTPLILDVRRVLEKLSPDQFKLCWLILNSGLCANEISTVFKKHRSTIFREIERIRKIFDNEGLREYWK